MKRFIAALSFACIVLAAQSQKIEDYFIRIPNAFIVQLEEAWRKDLVDLYKSGKPAILENTMQGKSVLKKLTDQYLLLQSTESSTVELKLLSLVNNTHIICMVETVYAPVADSRVSFFTTEWRPLPSDDIFTPVAEEWFRIDNPDETAWEYFQQLNIFLVKYSLSDENETLTAEYMTPLFLDDETRQRVKPFLKADPKIYTWKSGRFE